MSQLSDLNTHLFKQLDTVTDRTITGDALKDELERAKAATAIAKEITANSRLAFDIARAYDDLSLNAKDRVGNLIESK